MMPTTAMRLLLLLLLGVATPSAAFTITPPTFSAITRTSATVSITSSVPTRVRVHYEQNSGAPDYFSFVVPLSPTLLTQHAVALADLLPGRAYALRVDAVDAAGAVVSLRASVTTVAPDVAAPIDFVLTTVGTRQAVPGHTVYVWVQTAVLAGVWPASIRLDTSGLPPGSTLSFPYEPTPTQLRPLLAANWSVLASVATPATTPAQAYPITFAVTIGATTRSVVHPLTVAPVGAAPPPPPVAPIPATLRSDWTAAALTGGQKWCNPTVGGRQTDYDAALSWHRLAAHTGDQAWLACIAPEHTLYRDGYVLATNGAVAGYYVYPWGLYYDYLRTNSAASKQAALLLATNSAYATLRYGAPHWNSRETAFMVGALQVAGRLGAPDLVRLDRARDYVLGHIDQWFVSKTAPFVKPFFVGLALKALIELHEERPDPRIPVAVKQALDGLWACCWRAADQGFVYVTSQPPEMGAPDRGLNHLIAPAYAWLWKQTGNVTDAQRGDAILAGALVNIMPELLWQQKAYSQMLYWSPEYFRWR